MGLVNQIKNKKNIPVKSVKRFNYSRLFVQLKIGILRKIKTVTKIITASGWYLFILKTKIQISSNSCDILHHGKAISENKIIDVIRLPILRIKIRNREKYFKNQVTWINL